MRSHFSSSALVRLLGEASLADADASKQDVAERLSQWVGVFDAITLHAAHQSSMVFKAGEVEKSAEALTAEATALEAQLRQVRAVLAKAIESNEAAATEEFRGRPPRLQLDPPPVVARVQVAEPVADFGLYRLRYQDQQRKMELMVGPLRAHVRQVLSAASSSLRQLAALDAVWEQMLGEREQKALATVPGVLKRRFERLRKAQLQEVALDAMPAPATTWLDAFGKEMQEILLAELDVRLQPVTGLIEALRASAQRG